METSKRALGTEEDVQETVDGPLSMAQRQNEKLRIYKELKSTEEMTMGESRWLRIWRSIFITIIYIGIAHYILCHILLPYIPQRHKDPFSTYTRLISAFCGDFPNHGHDFYEASLSPDDLLDRFGIPNEIPQYVLDHAPYVHLFSGEQFWPCDMAEHLLHITPELDYSPIDGRLQRPNLTNLNELNEIEKGHRVYLTSDDDVEDRPKWLGGKKNIPTDFEETTHKDHPGTYNPKLRSKGERRGGYSDAPAVLVTVNKGNGIVDAFWFYFYSYNLGNIVLNVRWGNHVGDWEHTLVRFQHGKPKLIFFSEHNFGSAYTYGAVEKIGKRPVVYSAVGTHAMYALPGRHPYVLPLGLLHDQTDRGPLWDPALNAHTYTYNVHTNDLQASNHTPDSPTEWFFFEGRWGDKFYPLSDSRQYGLVGEYHYVSGPLGPRFKNLGRKRVCQGGDGDPCEVRYWRGKEEVRVFPGSGNGERSEKREGQG